MTKYIILNHRRSHVGAKVGHAPLPPATEIFVKTCKSEWMWLCCCWLEEDKRTKRRRLSSNALAGHAREEKNGGVCDDTRLMREKAGIELLLVEHYANLRKKTRKMEDACVYFFLFRCKLAPPTICFRLRHCWFTLVVCL